MTSDQLRDLCQDLVHDLEMADWPRHLKNKFRDDITKARLALATSLPTPVSERLPGPEPCWWFTPEGDEEYGWWVLEPDGMERHPQPTHWLPAYALPLPSGEVSE